MSDLNNYILNNKKTISIRLAADAILADIRQALSSLPKWERGFHIFWLLGPFILLIERSPADLWISVLGLTFVIRCIIKRDKSWLNPFWVRAGFAFWFWCLFTSAISYDPAYSIGEALVWFRFPLFAPTLARLPEECVYPSSRQPIVLYLVHDFYQQQEQHHALIPLSYC